MIKSAENHLAAIKSGKIERGNIIGLRKLINAGERDARGWSIGRTSAVVGLADLDKIESAISEHHPTAVGELHAGGLAVLRNQKYKGRWNDLQRRVIDGASRFDLLRFDRIGSNGVHCVPVFRVINRDGESFVYRNIPWQSGGNGPEIQGRDF